MNKDKKITLFIINELKKKLQNSTLVDWVYYKCP